MRSGYITTAACLHVDTVSSTFDLRAKFACINYSVMLIAASLQIKYSCSVMIPK